MAIGPSQRRNSPSGGSFSSRSSSRSSGSFSGGSNIPIFPRRPIRINFFGNRVIVSSGRQSLLLFLLVAIVFSVIATVFVGGIKNDLNSNIKEIKAQIADIEEINRIFDNAKQNVESTDTKDNSDYYYSTATEYDNQYKVYYDEDDPTGYYYNMYDPVIIDGYEYYYRIFKWDCPVDADGDGVFETTTNIEGMSYVMYTDRQAQNWQGKLLIFRDGDEWHALDAAYDSDKNMQYKFEKLELAKCEKTLKTMSTAFIVAIVIIVGLVAITILVVIKTIKKGKLEFEKQQKLKDEEIAKAKAQSEEAQRKAKQVGRHCQYCGSAVPDGADVCPSCGAAKFK